MWNRAISGSRQIPDYKPPPLPLPLKDSHKNSVNWNSRLLNGHCSDHVTNWEVLIGLQVPRAMQMVSILGKTKHRKKQPKFCLSHVEYFARLFPNCTQNGSWMGLPFSKCCRIVLTKIILTFGEVCIVRGVHLVIVLCINRHLIGHRVIIQLWKELLMSRVAYSPPQFTNDRTSLQCSMINLKTARVGHLTSERSEFA